MGTDGHMVHYSQNGQARSLHADYVWSTIPITALLGLLRPSPPAECLRAAENIEYRAMVLIYLILEQDRFSEYDAHYFPEARIPFSRLSEPKNYANGQGPENSTVLCAELPCSPDGPEWAASDLELGQLMCDGLKAAGLPVRAPVRKSTTRRLRQAYPIYRLGYEAYFDQLDRCLSEVDGLLTFGRQGLFVHDNTHHALYMGYAAAACLDEQGHFDREQWQAYRRTFETHVVED
jgi:protoporphyrinogen oxidase